MYNIHQIMGLDKWKKMLDAVKAEIAKNGVGMGQGVREVVQQQQAQGAMGTTGQGPVASEVNQAQPMQGDAGPIPDGQTLQLS